MFNLYKFIYDRLSMNYVKYRVFFLYNFIKLDKYFLRGL